MLWGAEGRHQLNDEMSAFEIWTAGVMLAGLCARFGRAGRFPHLGEFRFLFLPFSFFTTFIYPWGMFLFFLFRGRVTLGVFCFW